jgi:hypothetical protein
MSQKNHQQSLERIAERGGFSPAEAWCVVSGIKLTGMQTRKDWDTYNAAWFQYAERVNLHYDELA